MKDSLVLEIQKLSTDRTHDVCDLLRKGLMVATKLKLGDFKRWLNDELNGYTNTPIPEYRKATAEIKLKNPCHGLVPVHFPSQELADRFCRIEIRDPLGNIVSILESKGLTDTGPVYPLSPRQASAIMNQPGTLGLPPVRILSYGVLDTIIDSVRTKMLEWSLKLEEEGILGEGMTFSREEKERAHGNQGISIENFQGILGNVNESSVSQNLTLNITSGCFDELKSYLSSLGIEDDDIAKLQDALNSEPKPIRKGVFGPKLSDWLGTMVKKAATGAWNIGVTSAADLITKAICLYYGS